MLKKILFYSFVAILASCSNSSEKSETVANADSSSNAAKLSESQPENEFADFKFHMAITNIPSPFEVIDILAKSGFQFNKSLTNSTENEIKYQSSDKLAMNYGAYVVDLIYLSSNQQFGDIKKYFLTSSSMAQKLDAGDSFKKIAGSRIENNIDNRDSVNQLMDALYSETDNYLRSNDRLLVASQILTGSWIESQYLTMQLLKDAEQNDKNKVVYEKVFEQRVHIESLIKLLTEFEKEKSIKDLLVELKQLSKLYSEIKSSSVDKASISKLTEKLQSMRTKMIG